MASHGTRHPRLPRQAIPALGLTIALTLSLRDTTPPAAASPHAGHDAGMPMTEAAMRRQVDQWFSQHPVVGRKSTLGVVVADTFLVGPSASFRFDTDGNLSTVVDTAKILVGQAVLWLWKSGSHTVTNGTGSSDPQVGTLFDVPSNSTATTFTFTFNSAGTVPFFCRLHEFSNMKGVVVVKDQTDVPRVPGGNIAVGFTTGPTPNPSRSGVSFGFALRERGRVEAQILDGQGRVIATVLDRDVEAGSHTEAWDGRTRTGARAPAGIYYLRLRMPGFSGTCRIALAR